jgi:hypothetical protein
MYSLLNGTSDLPKHPRALKLPLIPALEETEHSREQCLVSRNLLVHPSSNHLQRVTFRVANTRIGADNMRQEAQWSELRKACSRARA